MKSVEDNLESVQLKYCPIDQLFTILEQSFFSKHNLSSFTTYVSFEILQRIIGSCKTDKYYGLKLNHLLHSIKQLSAQEKVSIFYFQDLLESANMDIPLSILYHLHNTSIYLYQAYVGKKDIQSLLNMIEEFFNARKITTESNFYICDFIIEINQHSEWHKPLPAGIEQNLFSWQEKCAYISNKFINRLLVDFILNPKNCALNGFISFSKKKHIKNKNFRNIFDEMLKFIVSNNIESISMMDAYLMQSLWTMEKNKETSAILCEIIENSSIRNLTKFMSVISSNRINWKYFLIFVAVYSTKLHSAQKQLKDLINNQLSIAFGTLPSDDCFVTSVLLSRQACLNKVSGFDTYSDWYAATFGINTTFKTGFDSTFFIRLAFYLRNMVEYEPEYTLRVHIDRSLKVPRGCQYAMHEFKNVCRGQMTKMKSDPTIQVDDLPIPLVCLLHHAEQSKEVILALRKPELCKTILPWLIGAPKYKTVIDLLVKNGLTCNVDIAQCKALYSDAAEVISDDSEELFQ